MNTSIVKNINSYRKFVRNNNDWDKSGDYVVYWMQANRRIEYNYALEYAVAVANNLQKPLLIYEVLNVDYPWACERFHHFILEGIKYIKIFHAQLKTICLVLTFFLGLLIETTIVLRTEHFCAYNIPHKYI